MVTRWPGLAPELRSPWSVKSNVYYLPGSLAAELPGVEPKPRFSQRLRHAGWRFRLALAEIYVILLHPRRRFTADDYAALFGGEADIIERPWPARPGRVIDLEAARRRLRPTS